MTEAEKAKAKTGKSRTPESREHKSKANQRRKTIAQAYHLYTMYILYMF